jgi:hypothetical protein
MHENIRGSEYFGAEQLTLLTETTETEGQPGRASERSGVIGQIRPADFPEGQPTIEITQKNKPQEESDARATNH